jgi:hypothetical protein
MDAMMPFPYIALFMDIPLKFRQGLSIKHSSQFFTADVQNTPASFLKSARCLSSISAVDALSEAMHKKTVSEPGKCSVL